MAVGDLLRQPREVEDSVHLDQNLVVGTKSPSDPATNRSACLRSPFPNMLITRRTTPQHLRHQTTRVFQQARGVSIKCACYRVLAQSSTFLIIAAT